MKKKLIVGKNSYLIKKLNLKFKNIDIVSHTDLDNINFNIYSVIFVFSYSKKFKENILFLEKIPLNKVVYISTASVLSLIFRKQPFTYPNIKSKVEDYLLDKKKPIICRLGYFPEFQPLPPNKILYPHTGLVKLRNFLVNFNLEKKNEKIINLFDVKKSKSPYLQKYKILDFFEDIKYFYFLISCIKKFLKIHPYGYTRDHLKAFAKNLQIGYGVIGSGIYKKYKSKIDLVLHSGMPNIELGKNGFIKTIIGKEKIGLAKYWHGSYDKFIFNREYIKKVILLNFFLLPSYKKFIKFNVESINTVNQSVNSGKFSIYYKRLILAAGPFENLRILNKKKINIKGSDHDNAYIGQISLKEALQKKFIRSFGFFIIRGNLFVNKNYILDFRPGYNVFKNNHYYKRNFFLIYKSKIMIILNSILNFDFERLNEAFFNKFGFAFKTKKIIACIQLLRPNCISLFIKNHKYVLIKRKKILKNEIIRLKSSLKNKFETIDIFKNPIFVDSQHVFFDIKNNHFSKKNFDKNKKSILIAGSPGEFNFGPLWHSIKLRNIAIGKLKRFLKN